MLVSSPATKGLHVLACAAALCLGSAAAANSSHAASPLRITEVTESSHPFETLYCARQAVQLRFMGALAEVVVNNESRLLRQAVSASGARYVAPNDDTTTLWNKGAFATITWSGQQLPLCAPAGAIIPPYSASGNEPFWTVMYDGWTATLKRPGEPDLVRDAKIAASSAQGQTLAAGEGAQGWLLEASDELCVDNMSGMSFPQRAALQHQSNTLSGCGGDTNRLLQGVNWRITHIGEQPANQAAAAHISFLEDNGLAGSSGCNRFFGQYALTGEGLSFKDMGSTRMACPAPLMEQEAALLNMLASVSRFSFEAPDMQRLILHTANGNIRLAAQAM